MGVNEWQLNKYVISNKNCMIFHTQHIVAMSILVLFQANYVLVYTSVLATST